MTQIKFSFHQTLMELESIYQQTVVYPKNGDTYEKDDKSLENRILCYKRDRTIGDSKYIKQQPVRHYTKLDIKYLPTNISQ